MIPASNMLEIPLLGSLMPSPPSMRPNSPAPSPPNPALRRLSIPPPMPFAFIARRVIGSIPAPLYGPAMLPIPPAIASKEGSPNRPSLGSTPGMPPVRPPVSARTELGSKGLPPPPRPPRPPPSANNAVGSMPPFPPPSPPKAAKVMGSKPPTPP